MAPLAPGHPLSHQKKASSSWYKHHWTLLEYTPSHLSHCNNRFPNLVQTRGVKMCTSTAVSMDACPIWPQMGGGLGCVVCLHVYLGGGGRRWRPSFISYGDQIFYMIWCDMIWWHRPSYGMGLCEKCDDRASGRLDWSDIWEGEGAIVHVREKERERKRWGENDHGVREMRGDRGKNDRKSDALKGNEDE